ncbi:AsmA-like C-terminal region-containing protein [Halomonas shantousis]
MSAFRLLQRWALTLLALGLVGIAVVLLLLRLAMGLIGDYRDEIETLLSRQFAADVQLESLEGRFERLDPALGMRHLHMTSQVEGNDRPLLDIEEAQVRLDTLASLGAGYPVIADAHAERVTLHLYQAADHSWNWPGEADMPDSDPLDLPVDVEQIDFWVEALLRQRVQIEQVRVLMHGLDETVTLVAPRLLLTGGSGRAHLEGVLQVEGQPDTALSTVLEVLPGEQGRGRFNAALQVDMNAGSLLALGRVLTAQERFSLQHVEGEATLWARWQDGQAQDVRLRLDVPELTLADAVRDTDIKLRDLGLRAQAMRAEDDSWDAWVNGLSLRREEDTESHWPAQLTAHWDTGQWWVRSTAFELQSLDPWRLMLPLPAQLDRALTQLSPQGRIEGAELGRRQGVWQGRVALLGAQATAWDGVPGGGPLDAWVEFEGRDGTAKFRGEDGMQLAFPEVFAAPLDLDYGRGEVAWHLVDGGADLEGRKLRAGWHGADAKGQFDVALQEAGPGHLDLELTFANVDARQTPLIDWLPTRVLEPELQEWLSGDMGGLVTEGRLSLSQTLTRREAPEGEMFANPDDRLSLALDIVKGRLQYAPEWPVLEDVAGHLMLENETLRAQIEQASAMGLQARNGLVTMQDEQLTVTGEVAGNSGALFDFLAAAPLEELSQTFAEWESQGQVDAELHIALPIETPEAVEVDATGRIAEGHLAFQEPELALDGINGELHYHHQDEQDILTGTLGARAFEGPLQAEFDVGGSGIRIEGRALARGLLDWAGLAGAESLLSGYFPYRADVAFDTSNNATLKLTSHLQGLAIHLPPPFGKQASDEVALIINADIAAGSGQVALDDWATARWRHVGELQQGQVWLEQQPQSPRWPEGTGWRVAWQPASINPQQWADALSGIDVTALPSQRDELADELTSRPGMLQGVSVSTPCLYVERCLGSMEVNAQPRGEDWVLSIAGSLGEGRAEWSGQADTPIDVELTRLNLDALLPAEEAAATTREDTAPITLTEQIAVAPTSAPFPASLGMLPAGRLRVATLEYNEATFGPLDARWEASDARLNVAPLTLVIDDMTASGELTWEASGEAASLTRARLDMTGTNVERTLEALGQPPILTSKQASLDAQLAWPGAPWQFALERSRGSLGVELRNGRFRNVDSASAKLLGLLNFDNILRRLALDFSDVTRQGTAFNSVDGRATLYDGRLETQDAVEIDGVATHFSLQGEVDLLRQLLDLRLGITVPVSQNLPLAALLVGAPQIGAGLFVAHKVFGRWLDQATQIHYRVHGPWSSPQITQESVQ